MTLTVPQKVHRKCIMAFPATKLRYLGDWAMHAERDIVMENPSVRLSVCPSSAGIVSR